MTIVFAKALLLVLSLDSAASVPVTGRVFADAYLPTTKPLAGESRRLSTEAWVEAAPPASEGGVYGRAILTARATDSARAFEAGLREAYAGYSRPSWELRAGRQIIPWGKADGYAPTDLLSAKDYTLANPDDEVRRIGGTSAWLQLTPKDGTSPLSFTAVWTPVAPVSRLVIADGVLPAGIQAADASGPSPSLSHSELALKPAISGAGWDFALVVFRGYGHLPELEIADIARDSKGLPTAVTVAPIPHRLRALGAEYSLALDDWVFRAESAYQWTENGDGRNPLIQPTRWDSVIAVEKPLPADLRALAQLHLRYHPRFEDPATAGGPDPTLATVYPEIARANALILGYQDRFRPAASGRLSHAVLAWDLEEELWVTVNFRGGDYLIRPKLAYALADGLKATLGADHYGGPRDRPLGALRNLNSVFVEAKFVF